MPRRSLPFLPGTLIINMLADGRSLHTQRMMYPRLLRMASPSVARLRPSIVRILVYGDDPSAQPFGGTGFFIAPGLIVTCAHVVLFHARLDLLLEEQGVAEKNADAYLRRRFDEEIDRVMVEFADGSVQKASDVRFDGAEDVALLTVEADGPVLAPGRNAAEIGDDVFLCGFPYAIQTVTDAFPFAVHKGHVTSVCTLKMGGYALKERMQLQLMALGGASGAPVFSSATGKPVAMINGHMTWGADRVAIMGDEASGGALTPDDVYVPLPLAFATPMARVLERAKML